MTGVEKKLLRGCVAVLDLWIETLGERDEAVALLRRIQEGGDVSDEDLDTMRNRLRQLAELAQAYPPIGHADTSRREKLGTLLRAVPAGWFQTETLDGEQVWLIHGMAPLATPELSWVYAETLRGERLK